MCGVEHLLVERDGAHEVEGGIASCNDEIWFEREALYLMEWTSDGFSHGELRQLQVDMRERDDV